MVDVYALAGFALLAEGACYAGKLAANLKFTRTPETALIKVNLKQYESPDCQKAINRFHLWPTPLDIIVMALHHREHHRDLEKKLQKLQHDF